MFRWVSDCVLVRVHVHVHAIRTVCYVRSCINAHAGM